MDQLSEHRNTVGSTTGGVPAEGLINAIVTEIERLEAELSVTPGPEFRTFELNPALANTALSYRDTQLPATSHQNSVASNFVEENCEEFVPSGNECADMLNRLQQKQAMVLKKNSNLENEVNQQREKILDLQKNNLHLDSEVNQQRVTILNLQKNNLQLDSEVKRQRETILELQTQLNKITEIYPLNFQTLTEATAKPEETQADQKSSVELADKAQTDFAEVDNVWTNEGSSSTDSNGMQPEQKIPSSSHNEDNLNESEQIRSPWSGEDDEKRIPFTFDSIEEPPQRALSSRKKPYDCKENDASSSNLKTQQKTHSDATPYKCMVCDKSFTRYYSLERHQAIHSSEKPLDCKECGHSFSTPSTLRRHKKENPCNKLHKCDVCQKEFRSLTSLKNHLRQHSRKRL